MRKKLLAILLIFLPTFLIGQVVNDSLLGTFYNQTITIHFSKAADSSHKMEFDCRIIQTEFDTIRLIKNLKSIKFKFINEKADKLGALEKPYKKNVGKEIYWINHKLISQDTVDINIGGWTIMKASKRGLSISAWCGGTMGYIPTVRFIKNENVWRRMSSDEIMEEKKKEWEKLREK
jgi:hypothetical protein